jgi:hypothetical protein
MLHHDRRPERTRTSGQDRETKRETSKDARVDEAVSWKLAREQDR